MINDSKLYIFTDGSSLGNPGPGGYGAILIFPKLEEVIELGGMKMKTTNNEMELSAIVSSFSYGMQNSSPTEVFTDSSYVINGITKWVKNWEKNGWRKKDKEEISHRALWETLNSLVKERELKTTISWNHVPGHVGVVGNERADEIATDFASGKNPELFRGKLSDYDLDILNIDIDKVALEKKKKKSSHSRKEAYSYISLVDGIIKIHKTWKECEGRVKGVNAKFKKAISEEDEKGIVEIFSKL